MIKATTANNNDNYHYDGNNINDNKYGQDEQDS